MTDYLNPPPYPRPAGLATFGHLSRADLNRPPGSTAPRARRLRKDKRKATMRRRKRRGWS